MQLALTSTRGRQTSFAVVLFVVVVLMLPAESSADVSGRDAKQSSATSSHRARERGTVFVDKDGVVTLTNQPQRYRHVAAYKEVFIRYEPIVVPSKYKTYTSADQYSAEDYAHLVRRYARRHGLDENLVYAMIQAESDFNPSAVSRAGACGLMQLMPGTAAEMNVTDIFDAAQNIAGGTQYMAKLLELFNGDVRLALAAYNAGPDTVRKYHGIPPYPETQDYVRKVMAFWKDFAGTRVPVRVNLGKGNRRDAPPAAKYTVRFLSGLTQPADNVTEEGAYYFVEFAGQIRRVHKRFVQEILEPA